MFLHIVFLSVVWWRLERSGERRCKAPWSDADAHALAVDWLLLARDKWYTVYVRHLFAMLASVAAGATATVLISGLPFVKFAYRSPSLHLAVELAAAFIALLAAYLLYGRYLANGALPDLALLCALATFGVTNLLFAALPAIGTRQNEFLTWAPLIGGLLATSAFAASAFLPDATIRRRGLAALVALAGCGLALAIVAGVILAVRDYLPLGIDPTLSPETSNRPRIVGDRGVLVLQLLGMVLFFAAAVGFARRAERSRDELMTWFAAGAVIAGFARLNYFLFPSIYSEWVYTGDILRLTFWLIILVGLVREISSYWRRLAGVAVLEERGRLARDLHDGLAQELAFIATQARDLARGDGSVSPMLAHVAAAAERALDESRSAIAALTLPLDEPVDAAVSRAAEDVAGRVGVQVQFELTDAAGARADVREALVRIVREAVTNAARHGRASLVRVELQDDGDLLRLRVLDDGVGFDPRTADGGFGLRSMRERAGGVGGRARISSTPGHGTAVDVEVPR
jgi:signal transduction histidine kinase